MHFFPWSLPPGDTSVPPFPDHKLPEDGNVADERTMKQLSFFAARWQIYIQSKGLMSTDAVQVEILSNPDNILGTKDGNNRLKAFLLRLEKLSGDLESIAKFRQSMVSFQVFLPVEPYVMQALAASTNGRTSAVVKTSDLTALLQIVAFVSGVKTSLEAESSGDFGQWVVKKLLPSTQWVQRLACHTFLRRDTALLTMQLVRPDTPQSCVIFS